MNERVTISIETALAGMTENNTPVIAGAILLHPRSICDIIALTSDNHFELPEREKEMGE